MISSYSIQKAFTNQIALQEEPILVLKRIDYFCTLDSEAQSGDLDGGDMPKVPASLEMSNTEAGQQIQASEAVDDLDLQFKALSFHTSMYALGNRLLIQRLKDFARFKRGSAKK
ncbi:hypothetical protein N7520_011643 [Penicillium odoratum]|uniref:uncharacterized protein n=1 Tax=Penicillium odoratum TaxID=1167516 RepID=UPI002548E551|nr:uncharacterized protein N7520_011643 [Penicillium odoratum]KAJ5746461.1 hypothetical protein N7520_011643 [Penicillium odoratum]